MRSPETAAHWGNPLLVGAPSILHGRLAAQHCERSPGSCAVVANSAYCEEIDIYSLRALRSRLRASSVENRLASHCHESIVLWRTERRLPGIKSSTHQYV